MYVILDQGSRKYSLLINDIHGADLAVFRMRTIVTPRIVWWRPGCFLLDFKKGDSSTVAGSCSCGAPEVALLFVSCYIFRRLTKGSS